MEVTGPRLTRREMLKLGLLGGAALALPLERKARTQLMIADRIPESALPEPFRVPFAPPPVLRPVYSDAKTDYYRMTMRAAEAQILPAPFGKTLVYGYDGVTPGPTIKMRRDRRAVVRHVNALPDRHPYLGYESTTSVHLHGADSPPQYDGWAEDVSRPGQYKDYVYDIDQNERTMWYHDHALHHTAENTYMGLAGFFVTDEGLGLSLPKGRYDVPLMIQDKIFAQDGRLIFDDGSSRSGHDSLFGDVILVNGKPWPVMNVERRKYLFRVLNASVSRGYDLALSSGEPFTVVGYDGGLGAAPVEVGSFRVGMAERYGVVVDFAKYRVGQQVVLENRGLENNADFPSTRQVMRFDVASEATDTSNNRIPEELNPDSDVLRLEESRAVRTRRWELGRSGGEWVVNDETWDGGRVRANPALGDVEVWEFENKSGGWFHPMHVHLIDFKILDRNGRPPFPYERGPKDVAYVGENETVRVITRFGPHEGRYMIHCHNVTHEDHDMMVAFEVGRGGPDPVTTAPPGAASGAPPLFKRRKRRRRRRR
jgi:FtsP/CotA-like multicopper oxidase with cupredoxin domain